MKKDVVKQWALKFGLATAIAYLTSQLLGYSGWAAIPVVDGFVRSVEYERLHSV